MVLIIMLIGVIICGIGILVIAKSEWSEETGAAIVLIGCGVIVGGIVWGGFLIDDCIEGRYIDDKIAVYQEENKGIENDIAVMVKQYQEHETKVFDMSEIDSPTTLVQMYPELKSNELVAKQMDVFTANTEKIKELKTKKINCEKAKFKLYFGGK